MLRNSIRGGTLVAALGVILVCSAPAGAQIDFVDCGFLEQGVTCPILFVSATVGGVYLLENTGAFQVGDMVFVIGSLDPGCITTCLQGDGCVFNNTIETANCGPPIPFIRGDVDGDAQVNGLVDSLFLLAWGFGGGPVPPCNDAADVDDDGALNPLVDALFLLSYSFVSPIPEPPPPFPDCGSDPTDDALDCGIIPPCP